MSHIIDEKGCAIVEAFQSEFGKEDPQEGTDMPEHNAAEAWGMSADDAVKAVLAMVEKQAFMFCRRERMPEIKDDVVQNSMLALRRAKFQGRCSLDTYLYKVVHTNFIKLAKKSAVLRETGEVDENFADPRWENSILEAMAARERVAMLPRLIDQLEDEEKEILDLLIIELSQKRIAKYLDVSYDTARQRITRLRQKLKKKMIASHL